MQDSRLKYALIAGLAFIAACAWMYALPNVYSAIPLFGVRLISLVITLSLFVCSLIVHFQGYAYIGSRFDSKLLVISARLIMIGLVLFLVAVLASVFSGTQHEDASFTNALIGFTITLLIVPGLLFAVSILRMYKQLGPLTIAAAILLPVSIVTIWEPWPAALVGAVSTYFLSQVLNTRY